MTFLLSLLAAKGLGALVGSIILLTRAVPGFADPALLVQNDTLYFETSLRHGFNKELDQILDSGSPVAVAYTLTLLVRDDEGATRTLDPVDFFHSAVYDPVEQRYVVFQSERSGKSDSLTYLESRVQAKKLLSSVEAPVVPLTLLHPGTQVACRVEAALNTITLEALERQELDLNTFWNYRYPRALTPWKELGQP